ncbi:MAG: MFS transporter [Clostridia bacterium]|nr:MFS transporter [Clostridia bacterium]
MKPFFLFSKEESETKVANNRLLSYAVGLSGQNMTYGFISQRLFVFLNTVLGIPASKTGMITGISTMWDAINDPLIGSIMDHRKYKPGYKMRPFLLWTAPIIGILSMLMFVDFGLSENKTVLVVLILYLLFDMFYSFQDIAIWGLSALSTPSAIERRRVAQWISIGAGSGGTIVGLYPMLKDIFVKNEVMTEKNTYLLFAVIFCLGGMIISMLAYRMKEKVEYAPEDNQGILKSLWNLRHNKTLIIICLARVVQCFSLTLPWEYFFESEGISYEVFGTTISGGTAQVVFSYVIGIPGAIFNLFTVQAIKKFGSSKRLLVAAEVANFATRILAFAFGSNERYKQLSYLLIALSCIGTAQILTNMKAIAERSLLTNSVDEMELKTGERTEGITFSMQNFVSKLTGAIPKFIQGTMLTFMGFNEKLGTGGSDTIRSQTAPRFLKYRWHQFILGPAIGSALYLIVILFLQEDSVEHVAEVERLIQEKRDAARLEAQKKADEATESAEA